MNECDLLRKVYVKIRYQLLSFIQSQRNKEGISSVDYQNETIQHYPLSTAYQQKSMIHDNPNESSSRELVKTASNNFANKSMKKFNLYSKPVKKNKSTFQIDPNTSNQKSSLSNSIDQKRSSEDSKRNTRYSSVDRYTPTLSNYKDDSTVNKENHNTSYSKRRPQQLSILDQLQNLPLSATNREHQITTPLRSTTPRTQMIVCNQCKETMPRELFFKHYDKECKGFRGYSNYTPQNVRESLKDILASPSLNTIEKPLDLLELKKQKIIKTIDKRRSSASYHQENSTKLQEGKIVYKSKADRKCCPFCEVFVNANVFEEHINECRLFSIVDNLKQGYLDKSRLHNKSIVQRPPTQSNENMRYFSKPSSPTSSKEGEDYSQAKTQFKQLRLAKNLVKNRVKKNCKADQQKQFNKVYDHYQDVISKRQSDISALKKERDELRENVKYLNDWNLFKPIFMYQQNLKAIKRSLDQMRIEIQVEQQLFIEQVFDKYFYHITGIKGLSCI